MRWAIFIAFLAFVLFCFACLWDTTLLTHTILWVFGWIIVNRSLRTPAWHREIVVREILRSTVEGGETKTFWRHYNTVLDAYRFLECASLPAECRHQLSDIRNGHSGSCEFLPPRVLTGPSTQKGIQQPGIEWRKKSRLWVTMTGSTPRRRLHWLLHETVVTIPSELNTSRIWYSFF